MGKDQVDTNIKYIKRCIELASEALEAGDEPFGSILVSADGRVLHEARNRAMTGDPTQHPEFELARWAAQELPVEERRTTVVYTSGEHCPMCAAAHAWAGLGRIVYASSSKQLGEWLVAFDAPPLPLAPLGIPDIAPDVPVEGPFPGLDERVRALHARFHGAVG
ncbi:nucleoside deaminase [uncultured Jannaschia sp.]|uniref:nucleoside deaminase n=1 Tax=uncultured Jannaschia sp. TaxID=293347 RepID=UPI00262A963F|nr:nucleoside deaminase [uncultured Jannaschia sp.]